MQMKNDRGITLLSLIVTIVVLIILTSITIIASIGDNGLITILQQGQENIISEQEERNTKLNQIDKEREKTGIISPTGGGTNNSTRDDTGVNAPVLGEGMIPVKNNGNNWIICSTDDIEWFDYSEQTDAENSGETSRWANVMLSDGVYKAGENAKIGTIVKDSELGSMFVWIPRYAYKITYYIDDTKTTESTSNTNYGKIDVKFINGKDNIAWDKTECKYSNDTLTKDDYIVHPAFTGNAELGGGFGELSGLWVGKFESSRKDATITSEGKSTMIKVIPNVTSWRNTSVGELSTLARQYNEKLSSHMLKNSEWGAVAYLSYSKYGRNGNEISTNQCENYITGAGQGINNTTYSYSTFDFESTYSYNTTQGKKASTTGNVYGIYDMVGGANEIVASYYNNSDKLVNGSSFANIGSNSNEYSIAYLGTDEQTNYLKGDSTFEVKKWNFDSADFTNAEAPFFVHGGYYIGMENVGIFSYGNSDGLPNSYIGFRICLVTE